MDGLKLVSMIAIFALGSPAVIRCAQPDTPMSVLKQPSMDLEKARQRLLAFGDSAVGPVTEAIRVERNLTSIRAAFLVGILAEMNTSRARSALMQLLGEDDRPMVRAYIATALGQLHDQCAVPALITAMADSREYGVQISTEPAWYVPLTVGTESSEALRRLTGVEGTDDSRDATPHERWWRENGPPWLANVRSNGNESPGGSFQEIPQ